MNTSGYSLQARPLSCDAFKDYGMVIDIADKIPSSQSNLHEYWDSVSWLDGAGRQVCSLLRTYLQCASLIDKMECHYDTQEILLALDSDVIISTARAGSDGLAPDENTIQCFLLKQGTGIVMNAGTWHALPATLCTSSLMLVIFKENTAYSAAGSGMDIHFRELQNPFKPVV